MTYPKKVVIIVCEGNSEYAYIQELNRYLDDNDYPFIFAPKIIGCGHYQLATKKYNAVRRENPRTANIQIWVDKDTYIRNDTGDKDNYRNKPAKIPDFLFSHNNFEDFLTMHLQKEQVETWHNICANNNHFANPMHAETYEPLYTQHILSSYKKGEMPFEINDDMIGSLLNNQEDQNLNFKCDFAILFKVLCNKANK